MITLAPDAATLTENVETGLESAERTVSRNVPVEHQLSVEKRHVFLI